MVYTYRSEVKADKSAGTTTSRLETDYWLQLAEAPVQIKGLHQTLKKMGWTCLGVEFVPGSILARIVSRHLQSSSQRSTE